MSRKKKIFLREPGGDPLPKQSAWWWRRRWQGIITNLVGLVHHRSNADNLNKPNKV
jgi:hypothetical protein